MKYCKSLRLGPCRGIPAFLMTLALAAATPLANATIIADLVGDKDCFGVGGACPDGPGSAAGIFGFSDLSFTGSDPAFTDRRMDFGIGTATTYSHTIGLGGGAAASATLEVRTFAVADNRGPWDVFVNSNLVGTFPNSGSSRSLPYRLRNPSGGR